MSTPGRGSPQPPEQDPHQPGQPGPWGQQPPAGWGQQPPAGEPAGWGQPPGGQPQAGSSAWSGQQPDGRENVTQPQQFGPGQFGPPQLGQPQFGQPQFGQPQYAPPQGVARQKPKRKWLPIVAGVVGLIVVLNLVRGLMAGDPEGGDCIRQTEQSGLDTVDCSSDEAEFRILGTDADMTGEEFDATDPDELCGDFAEATSVFWYGSDESDGTVYCAEDVRPAG